MSGFDVNVRLDRHVPGRETFQLDVTFASPNGVTVIFGPSGAGKSTLLLALLGALRPERGRIVIGPRVLFDARQALDLPVRKRRVGMVFQDSLLFPHLDVLHNVAFGIQAANRIEPARQELRRVGAEHLSGRRPAELSGGERQRVALARSLAARPDAVLLDEPFSALDVRSRESLGDLLCELQAEAGIPFLHVTHDLGEALRLGNYLVLLDAGRVVQSDSPASVVSRPASRTAAGIVGTENLFDGRIVDHLVEQGCSTVEIGATRVVTGLLDADVGSRVLLGLRAEDALISLEPLRRTSARNVLAGTIRSIEPRGTALELRVCTPVPFRVLVTPAAVDELELTRGKSVHLLIKAAAFHRLGSS